MSPRPTDRPPSEIASGAGSLLAALIVLMAQGEAARDRVASLLAPDVRLIRLDGVTVVGSAAVLESIVARDGDAAFRLLEERVESCLVAMQVRALGGHFRLAISGRVADGRLVEITLSAD